MTDKNLLPLKTIPEVVTAFGGTKALAAWCGIGMSNISDWKHDGRIPPNWSYRLDREARRRGFLIDPAIFGERPFPHETVILDMLERQQ